MLVIIVIMTSFSFSFSNPRHANFKEEPRQRIAELLGSKRSGKLFIPSATLKDGRSERNQKSARVLRGIPAALPRRLNIMHSGFDRSRTDFYQQKKNTGKKKDAYTSSRDGSWKFPLKLRLMCAVSVCVSRSKYCDFVRVPTLCVKYYMYIYVYVLYA